MLSGPIPPVGMNLTSGYVAETARRNAGPPTVEAGNTFSVRSPSARARSISPAVATPGKNGIPMSWQACTTSSFIPGASAKCAPASAASCACSPDSTAPAPTSTPSTARARRMASAAAAVRKVTSMHETPPRTRARAVASACSPSSRLVTGTTRTAPSRFTISDSVAVAVPMSVTPQSQVWSRSPLHLGRLLEHCLDVLLARHGLRVAGNRDGTGAGCMRHAQASFRRKLTQPPRQETGDERVASADRIDDGPRLGRGLARRVKVDREGALGSMHDHLPVPAAPEEPLGVSDLVTADQ